ncbi:unnamed protein product [Meganyctiphanes norvegica]|uniref:Uncharacterized protein n=1 Tax=Meganyctiphanes norvegica TaxID=48144 RepID=A0AAV2QST3_MEGNR
MARFALMFSVVLVVVLVSVLVESTPQNSPYFNVFTMLNGIGGRAPAPRRGRQKMPNNRRYRARIGGRSSSRSSDDGKGKYWNNYDKDGYGRNGRDVSHVLAAHTPQVNIQQR